MRTASADYLFLSDAGSWSLCETSVQRLRGRSLISSSRKSDRYSGLEKRNVTLPPARSQAASFVPPHGMLLLPVFWACLLSARKQYSTPRSSV